MPVMTQLPFGTRLDRKSHVSRIQKSLGQRFNAAEIAAIDQLGTMITVAAGTSLIMEDRSGTEALIVVEGRAAVRSGDEIVAMVSSGGILGEGALLNARPRNASVTAESEMTVIALTPREFSSLLDRCPDLEQRVRSIDAIRQTELG